jgi:hypothetical protein
MAFDKPALPPIIKMTRTMCAYSKPKSTQWLRYIDSTPDAISGPAVSRLNLILLTRFSTMQLQS